MAPDSRAKHAEIVLSDLRNCYAHKKSAFPDFSLLKTDCKLRWPNRERPQWCTKFGVCAVCAVDEDCGTPPPGTRFGCATNECLEIPLDACESTEDCRPRLGCMDGYCRPCTTDAHCGPEGVCLDDDHGYTAIASSVHDGCFQRDEVDPSCLDGACPYLCTYDFTVDTGCTNGCVVCVDRSMYEAEEEGDYPPSCAAV